MDFRAFSLSLLFIDFIANEAVCYFTIHARKQCCSVQCDKFISQDVSWDPLSTSCRFSTSIPGSDSVPTLPLAREAWESVNSRFRNLWNLWNHHETRDSFRVGIWAADLKIYLNLKVFSTGNGMKLLHFVGRDPLLLISGGPITPTPAQHLKLNCSSKATVLPNTLAV
jgi:hypothetical protein